MQQNGITMLDGIVEALADAVSRRILANQSDGAKQARLLSVDQAAEYLGRTPRAVRNLIRTGKLQTVRIDRLVRLDRQDLDRTIDLCKGGAL